jgi:glutamate--cysteine ligase|tara:strand:+ start:202 stop:1479 length:1278 start_codon:yes stop_codon:yes gene_type:complete
MIPTLKVKPSSQLLKLENYIINHSCDIEHWFRNQWKKYQPPFYASVDLRNSGFKLAPVDTNLFPAGFNNLCETFLPLSIQAASVAIEKICPEAKKVMIIAESHTRNVFYLKNIYALSEILKNSGLEVKIGTIDPEIKESLSLEVDKNLTIEIEPITRDGDYVSIMIDKEVSYRPCAIILNNDLSGGEPKILKGINQNLIPPLNAGWHKRRKSDHFTQYNKVVDEFSQFTDIDPWLINPYFEKLDNLNFQERKGENELASIASNMLKNINKKYKQYNIAQEAYLVVKANAGTYGMGIMIIKNSEDILNLNRKMRKKMSVIKGGAIVTEVIIQEGIHTEESIDESVAEPVIYMIDRFVVGGFFRVHTNKEKDENLNSPGMHFIPQPFETSCIMPDQGRPCDDEANRFYAYGVIARLALIAAARELQE